MMDNKGFAFGWFFLGTFGIITHMNIVSTAKRSAMMRLVKGKNTKPEMVVRRLLHADGYRYWVNYRELIGTPDLVFSKRERSYSSMVVFGTGIPVATGQYAQNQCALLGG